MKTMENLVKNLQTEIDNKISELQVEIDNLKNYQFDEKDIKYKAGYYDWYNNESEVSEYKTYEEAFNKLFYLYDRGFLHGAPVFKSFISINDCEFDIEHFESDKLLKEYSDIKNKKEKEKKDKEDYERLKKKFGEK